MKYSVLFTALLSVNEGNVPVTLKKISYMKNISQYFNYKKGFSDIIGYILLENILSNKFLRSLQL